MPSSEDDIATESYLALHFANTTTDEDIVISVKKDDESKEYNVKIKYPQNNLIEIEEDQGN